LSGDALQHRTGTRAGIGVGLRALSPTALAALYLVAVLIWVTFNYAEGPYAAVMVGAAVVGGYMALNVGANDVANNMGPAVGANALTLGGALLIAAVCEAAGALLAGGDVVATISRGIVRPDEAMGAAQFIMVMLASLLAAALWIHLATFLGAPVSTTHSIVGGVLGAGVASSGLDIVSWPTVGAISASWVISPILGGVGAALLLAFIRQTVIKQPDLVAAARRWVPLLVALMSGVFTAYLATKGLSRIWRPGPATVLLLSVGAFAGAWLLARPWVRHMSRSSGNRRNDLNHLFILPLIVAAALLSFAHGANDVANAVGPLAAIVATAQEGHGASSNIAIPFWVMGIGAIGLAVGLGLFGPRVIRTVGKQITKLDPVRAYCVALSAAGTVLVASALGLPVSSTHITVGGIFGVGFVREAWRNKGIPNPAIQPRTRFLKVSALNKTPEEAVLRYQSRERRRLVRRQHVLGIIATWVITLPATALLAGLLLIAMRAGVDRLV